MPINHDKNSTFVEDVEHLQSYKAQFPTKKICILCNRENWSMETGPYISSTNVYVTMWNITIMPAKRHTQRKKLVSSTPYATNQGLH